MAKIETAVWQDKKRYLGMPISFTKYYIDNDRLYTQIGLLKTELNEILLYRVLDIKCSMTLGQKIFGVGTVTIYSADQNNRTLELKNIKNPVKTHKLISDLVETIRKNRGVAGREMIGAAGLDMDHIDECHICDSIEDADTE